MVVAVGDDYEVLCLGYFSDLVGEGSLAVGRFYCSSVGMGWVGVWAGHDSAGVWCDGK